jgi:hypothetical protein
VEIDGWPGTIGHNWGSEHARRWVWLHAAELEGGSPGDLLDIAAGRVGLGPLTTPWIANGVLVIGGEEHRLGGPGRTYGTGIEAGPDACTFTVPGKGINLRGRVAAPRDRFVGWRYSDPGGGAHDAHNCSIADLEVRVERPGRRHADLRAEGTAAYESGTPPGESGMPIEPFEDG